MDTKKPKVVAIVGPTSSGKTSLSIKLAHSFSGEVISADSRQVYRGLDIGSGKVTQAEMGTIPHHLLDIADPTTVYTAADFARDGRVAIEDIVSRGHLPIIAGGTFQYLDTLLGRMSAPAVPPDPVLRATLETKSLSELTSILSELDSHRAAAIDTHNPRRLIRAIEIATTLGHVPPHEPQELYDVLTIGIDIPKETLHHNIHMRLHDRLAQGMLAEVQALLAVGVSHERLESLGLEYRYLSRYLRDTIPYDTMVVELETKIRQFAKRQLTWLKRDPHIIWVSPDNFETIQQSVQHFLDSTPIQTP